MNLNEARQQALTEHQSAIEARAREIFVGQIPQMEADLAAKRQEADLMQSQLNDLRSQVEAEQAQG